MLPRWPPGCRDHRRSAPSTITSQRTWDPAAEAQAFYSGAAAPPNFQHVQNFHWVAQSILETTFFETFRKPFKFWKFFWIPREILRRTCLFFSSIGALAARKTKICQNTIRHPAVVQHFQTFRKFRSFLESLDRFWDQIWKPILPPGGVLGGLGVKPPLTSTIL